MPLDLPAFIEEHQTRTSALLMETLSTSGLLSEHATVASNQLVEAMRYSLLNGGKRIRPILVQAAAQAVDSPNKATDLFAAALESIHAYSLVHDDLPAMDDDNLRRGNPTCHIAFNEATAILAGDGLHCLAFEIIANTDIPPAQAIKAIAVLAEASGARGMVLGQAIDLASVDKTPTLQELEIMHQHKTGALIRAAVELGGISVNASATQLAQLITYAEAIGLAFQVQDDILDVTADTATLGKVQGADAQRNKPTYVSLLGLDGARQKAEELLATALNSIADFGEGADYLRGIARYIIDRDH